LIKSTVARLVSICSLAEMPRRGVRFGHAAGANDDHVAAATHGLPSARILILANLLRRAAALRYRRLLHLTGGQWGVITHIGNGKPQNLNQIANGMGLEKAQISRTVSGLVRRHLLSKKINPENSREVLISLTREGRVQYQTILAAGQSASDRLLMDLSDQDRQLLIRRIETLTNRARELLKAEQALGTLKR
jgi:DNA-binding MarR family transcriptional regulator